MSAPTQPNRGVACAKRRGPERTAYFELFFDLVQVFAIIQLSHFILGDLSLGGVARAIGG